MWMTLRMLGLMLAPLRSSECMWPRLNMGLQRCEEVNFLSRGTEVPASELEEARRFNRRGTGVMGSHMGSHGKSQTRVQGRDLGSDDDQDEQEPQWQPQKGTLFVTFGLRISLVCLITAICCSKAPAAGGGLC